MANTTNTTTRIKHVFGNVLKLAIPLTLRVVTLDDGDVVTTDYNYTPSSNYKVVVQFVNGPLKYELDATIRDSYIAVVEDKGTIPVGTYAIVVLCRDDNGDPRRFKQRCVLDVFDVTADAGIEVGIEFETQEWLLEGAIFLAVKGEDGLDGVGIESITTDETSVSGEYNQVTFHLTNGSSYTLNVRNGESTEQTLPANVVVDENYVHTDNNYTNTDKQKISNIDKLFGDVVYDRISRRLNFFRYGDQTHTTPLKSIDITDFVRDGRVSSFRIIDGNLTIKLNSDGGNEEFKIPILSIFNPNNYYTKEQVEDRFLDSGFMTKEDFVYEDSNNLKYGSAPEIVLTHIEGVSPYEEMNSRLFGTSDGHIKGYVGATGSQLFDYGLAPEGLVFLDKTSGLLYRWTGSSWQQVGGSSGGGSVEQVQADWEQTNTSAVDYIKNKPTIPAAQVQADWNQTTTTAPDYIKNKPTIPAAQIQADWTQTNTLADDYIKNKPTKVSDFTNDSGFTSNAGTITGITMNGASKGTSGVVDLGTVITAHQDISGKANASDVYTKTQTYNKDELDAMLDDIEAGDTIVVNSDGANIVDEHDNNSVLFAPSARQMKLMYENVMAIYNGLANTAFTNGKPTLDWIGSKTKYTLSYGTLTGCTADVAAGQVNEGGLRIKLTPTQASYAFTSVTVNSNSVTTTSADDGLGSVYIDIIVNGNIAVAATAISGWGIDFTDSTGCSISAAGAAIGQDLDTTITANEHFTLPSSITVKIGNTNVTHTYTRAQDNKTATLHIDAANITGDLTITCTAVEDAHVTIAISGSNFVVKQGNTQLSDGSKVYNSSAAQTLTIEPASGYKFSTLPSADKGTMTNNGPYEASSLEIGTSVSGTLTITATASALQTFSIDLSGLVGVTSSNAATSIQEGAPYSTTLSKTDASASGSVIVGTCTMANGTLTINGTVISANHVTGNIVISANIGVLPAKVHSFEYTPSYDGDNKRYLNDSVGDFWLYNKSDASLPAAYPSGSYGNVRSGKNESGATGYGSHRVLSAMESGTDFTVKVRHLVVVPSSSNPSLAYNSSQPKVQLYQSTALKWKKGQFQLILVASNGATNHSEMALQLGYGTGSAEKYALFNDVTTVVSSQNTYDYLLSFVASTQTATVYRVTLETGTVEKCGEKVVDEVLNCNMIAYVPSQNLNGLDIYNYAMSQSDIESEYSNNN